MIMKNNKIFLWMILLATVFFACEENEIMPEFTKTGTVTSTVATLASSNAKPLPAENITLTLNYVNPSEDPLSEIVLKAKVGAGDFVELETLNVQSDAKDKMISKTVDYVVTAPKGSVITFDMVINSQKEYPMVRRTTVTVQ